MQINPEILLKSIYKLFNSDFSKDVVSLQDRKLLIVNSLEEDEYFRRQAEHIRRILKHEKSFYIIGR